MIEIVLHRTHALMWTAAIREGHDRILWSSIPYKWKTAEQAFKAGLAACENLDITVA